MIMAARIVWAQLHLGDDTILTCGHVQAGRLPLGSEVACEACMLWFTAALDQELAYVREALATREPQPSDTQSQ